MRFPCFGHQVQNLLFDYRLELRMQKLSVQIQVLVDWTCNAPHIPFIILHDKLQLRLAARICEVQTLQMLSIPIQTFWRLSKFLSSLNVCGLATRTSVSLPITLQLIEFPVLWQHANEMLIAQLWPCKLFREGGMTCTKLASHTNAFAILVLSRHPHSCHTSTTADGYHLGESGDSTIYAVAVQTGKQENCAGDHTENKKSIV